MEVSSDSFLPNSHRGAESTPEAKSNILLKKGRKNEDDEQDEKDEKDEKDETIKDVKGRRAVIIQMRQI